MRRSSRLIIMLVIWLHREEPESIHGLATTTDSPTVGCHDQGSKHSRYVGDHLMIRSRRQAPIRSGYLDATSIRTSGLLSKTGIRRSGQALGGVDRH
jgi:hypothetical protein